MEKIRLELHYYGRVQGVGFRYWAHTQAIKAKVTGWARNEYDGSVTVQVQGTSEQIDLFMHGVANGNRFIQIRKIEKKQIPLDKDERQFGVRY
ncbi:MAG: acylphosphatase [Lachnospiraceae bacterium]|nr:acylphosphatase [Lachnospiraceae bacterium]